MARLKERQSASKRAKLVSDYDSAIELVVATLVAQTASVDEALSLNM